MPQAYRTSFDLADDELVRVLAVQASGTRAFEELVVSRALLFQKLYHHQKVRALEGMVANAIELLAQDSEPFKKISTYLSLTDDQFLLGNWPSAEPAPTHERAKGLVQSVITRQSFVRAAAFGPTLVKEEDKWDALASLIEDKGRKELRRDVTSRAREYLTKVGQPGLAGDLDESSLLIDLPDVQGIVAKTRFFVSDDQLGVRKYGEGHEARRWTEAYEFQNTLGYVYYPRPFAKAVYFAFRDIAFEQAGVTFRDESWSLAKQGAKDLAEFSDLLIKASTLHVSRFVPPEAEIQMTRLRNTDRSKRELLEKFEGDLARMEHRFRTYKSSNNRVASRVEILEWLLQFQHEDIPIAIQTLQAVNFWDRAALADALRYAFEEVASQVCGPKLQVFGIGGATTSAQHLTYLCDDIRQRVGFELIVLNSIDELTAGVPLALYDDNVGSGGQSKTVLMQWFDVERSRLPVTEKHVQPLDLQTIETLRSCDLSVCYVTGKSKGLQQVVETVSELSGKNCRGLIVAPTDLSCFSAAARVYGTHDEAQRAQALFFRVGVQALEDRRADKSVEWITGNSLGYGNSGGLTAFYYNTPTTTLTALWKDNSTVATRWRALFPRRPRLH